MTEGESIAAGKELDRSMIEATLRDHPNIIDLPIPTIEQYQDFEHILRKFPGIVDHPKWRMLYLDTVIEAVYALRFRLVPLEDKAP